MTYIKPTALASSFTCPHCQAISRQDWWSTNWDGRRKPEQSKNPIRISACNHCQKPTIWFHDRMYYPDTGIAPPVHTATPIEIAKLYREAASIADKSPRGAAALLRLSIELLCMELALGSKDINAAIKRLVEDGLPKRIQQSLDVVRVIGNEAVHPGTIDTDEPETVQSLFGLVNIIVEYMIESPHKVTSLYNSLPEVKRQKIEARDKPKTPKTP